MELVADEGIDRQIVDALRSDGQHVDAIAESCPGATDDLVLAMAAQAGALLLTFDKDFGELAYRQGRASAGVLLVRLAGETPTRKAELVVRVVASRGPELVGAFSVLESDRLRIRRPVD